MKKKLIFLFLALLLALGSEAFAGLPVIAFFQNTSGGVKLVLPDGKSLAGASIDVGYEIPIGTTVITENRDFMEVKLSNGTIIKISENTNFKISAIQGESGAGRSEFDMQVGRFRTVAGRGTGTEQYQFRTRTAVCGVRGTDTGAESLIDPATMGFLPSKVFVFDGEILVTKLDEAGKALGDVVLKTGQWFDTAAADLKALIMSEAQRAGFSRGLEFQNLDPSKVPGHTGARTSSDTSTTPGTTSPGTDTEIAGQPSEEPEWVKSLREILGMEIGTITIGNETWAKAVLTPVFRFNKLKLALYLPVIYKTNMFDAADWYKPDGNWEWSFGTDASFGNDWFARSGDFLYDLVLKVKGLEWGDQRDNFYLRLGNLHSFTIGHGTMMRNYANDSDFPSIRRIGFNIGIDSGPFGFELVSNDLGMLAKYEPEVAGGRVYWKPAYPAEFAFGLDMIADFNPARGMTGVGAPMFFSVGVDTELPIVESDLLGIVLFADASVMLPYFREAVGAIPAGFAFDAILHNNTFANYGITAGVLGNVWVFDWRFEGRYYTGKYRPSFYNAIYDRVKYDYVTQVVDYLQNPGTAANNSSVFGIYGEGTFTMEKIFSITMGYLCPLEFTQSGSITYADEDYFMITFELLPKVIPFVGIYGSISYERTGFASGFDGGLPELFDENTVVRTTIGYPITPGLDILLHYTTTRVISEISGLPELQHALTIETVIDF